MTHPLPHLVSRLCQRTAGLLLWLMAIATPTWAGLTVNGNATVTDSTTSLVWDQCPYGKTGATCATGTHLYGTWAGALDAAVAANTASYKGFTDWRVPNKNELESIAKINTYTSGVPAIDTTAFPGTPLDYFLTSTTYAPFPSNAWIVGFDEGGAVAGPKAFTYYVRLVRSGQSFASFDVLAQTITFANPGAQTMGTTPTLTATASSSLAPTFTSATTGVCTITTGGALTFVTAGTCTIRADQAGNGSFNAAPQVAQSFTVNAAVVPVLIVQNISFGTAPTLTAGGTGTVSATGGASGNSVVFSSSTPAACSVNASTGQVNALLAGTANCTITANQAGNSTYDSANAASQTISIAQLRQVISFGGAPSILSGRTGTVTAMGGLSGNPVVFASSTLGVCSVNASTGLVTGLGSGSGTCTITANQAGNTNYQAAAQTSQSFAVTATSGSFELISGQERPLLATGQVSLANGTSLNVADGTATMGSNLQLTNPTVCVNTGAGASTSATGAVQLVIGGQTLQFSPVAQISGSGAGAGSSTVLVLAQGLVNGQAQALPQLQSGSTVVSAPANAAMLVAGDTVLTSGSKGAQVIATKELSGATVMEVSAGSISLPCAANLCAGGQTELNVLAGERMQFDANGKLLSLQLGRAPASGCPASAGSTALAGDVLPPALLATGIYRETDVASLQDTSTRLGGKTLTEMLSQALQTAFPRLGLIGGNGYTDLNGLTIGFGSGAASSSLSALALPPITINPSLPDGVQELPDGTLQVVVKGLVVRLMPALTDTAVFSALLRALTRPSALAYWPMATCA